MKNKLQILKEEEETLAHRTNVNESLLGEMLLLRLFHLDSVF
jgi:hypothetical protein